MSHYHPTAPFGRRPLTLAQVAANAAASARPAGRAVHKWSIFRAICAAREHVGVTERALAVLDALLSFHPETVLEGEGLVVFPSNQQLSLRAHGMAAATLRRHLAALVSLGLILRRDSPNGKRYARKGSDGGIDVAFGFDLGPLVARAEEFVALAERVRSEERAVRQAKERITICRREVTKCVTACIEERVPASPRFGSWQHALTEYRSIVARLGRRPAVQELERAGDDLAALAAAVLKELEKHVESLDSSANESHSERHKQNSNPNHFTVLEPVRRNGQGRTPEPELPSKSPATAKFPLGLVLTACPDLSDYVRGGISSWRDLLLASATVRPMLGISPSAWQDATDAMGELQAAVAVGCILQKGAAVRSPGGYLRELTRRAAAGQFSLGPMLMALIGGRSQRAQA